MLADASCFFPSALYGNAWIKLYFYPPIGEFTYRWKREGKRVVFPDIFNF